MGIFAPSVSGLGSESYHRIQKETAWGTAEHNAMTFLPVSAGKVKYSVADIEKKIPAGSRLKLAPQDGRIVVAGELELPMPPALLGTIMQLFLGTSANAGDANAGYTHTWLLPTTGYSTGNGFTLSQAIGGNLEDIFAGMTIAGITMSSDTEGYQKIKLDIVGKSLHVSAQARQTTFTYTTKVPFNFGMTALAVDPTTLAIDSFALNIKSYELKIDLGYDKETWYLGDTSILRPHFKTIPSVSFKCTTDADDNFTNWARSKNYSKLTLSTVHTSEQAGAVSGKYSVFVEIPSAKLSPETEIKDGYDRLDMELNFDCGYGGVSTGSGSTPVMAEIRVLDDTASYA